jgi:hypothetical protein
MAQLSTTVHHLQIVYLHEETTEIATHRTLLGAVKHACSIIEQKNKDPDITELLNANHLQDAIDEWNKSYPNIVQFDIVEVFVQE